MLLVVGELCFHLSTHLFVLMSNDRSIAVQLHVIAEKGKESDSDKYSSFQCIGGSQALDTNSMKQAAMQKVLIDICT